MWYVTHRVLSVLLYDTLLWTSTLRRGCVVWNIRSVHVSWTDTDKFMQLAANRVNFFVWLQSFNDARSFVAHEGWTYLHSGVERILAGKLHLYVTLAMCQVDAAVAILHCVQFVHHFPKLCVVTADATAIALSNLLLFVFSVCFIFQCVCESFFLCVHVYISVVFCVCVIRFSFCVSHFLFLASFVFFV